MPKKGKQNRNRIPLPRIEPPRIPAPTVKEKEVTVIGTLSVSQREYNNCAAKLREMGFTNKTHPLHNGTSGKTAGKYLKELLQETISHYLNRIGELDELKLQKLRSIKNDYNIEIMVDGEII